MNRRGLTADARRVLFAQALRALAYGFGSVLLGVTLDERGLSSMEAGLVIAAVVAGTVLASMLIGRYADGLGRRRCYVILYLVLAVVGVVFALSGAAWLLIPFALTGALSTEVIFAVGVLQTGSFLVAPRLAERFGLLRTTVFTHLPSNILLASIAFAPTLGIAVALLLARTVLSQMDVPTRQAYVVALVTPEERTAAAAYTNTARYIVRPIGPLFAGAAQSIALGLPFLLAGSIKSVYDLILWHWFSHVELPEEPAIADAGGHAHGDGSRVLTTRDFQ